MLALTRSHDSRLRTQLVVSLNLGHSWRIKRTGKKALFTVSGTAFVKELEKGFKSDSLDFIEAVQEAPSYCPRETHDHR